MRKVLGVFVCLLWFVCSLFSVDAATGLDDGQVYTMTFSLSPGIVGNGASVSLYRVGESDGTFDTCFLDSGMYWDVTQTDGSVYNSCAEALETYIIQQRLEPYATSTFGSDGRVAFVLDEGMYLLSCLEPVGNDDYLMILNPHFFIIPFRNPDGDIVYDMSYVLKYGYDYVPDESGSDSLMVLKVWEDEGHELIDRPDAVHVDLLGDGVVKESVVLNSDCNWRYTWENLFSAVQWTVVETDVPEGYEVAYDFSDGVVVITNTWSDSDIDDPDPPLPGSSLTVTKLWADDNDAAGVRPSKVDVNLLCDGDVYESVVLNQACNWKYTWPDLDSSSVWTVEEVKVPDDYGCSYETIGDRVVITNTYTGPDEPPVMTVLPNTGGHLSHWVLLYAGGVACFIIGVFVHRRLKRKI